MRISIFFVVCFSVAQALAWGKRGHEMVGSLAAQLLAKEHPQGAFLASHSFDMGYYNNAPDLVWKANPEIYKKESPQHYVDIEIFERAFKKRNETNAWNPSRLEFTKKFPEINEKAGRSPWRIQELVSRIEKTTQSLKNKKLTKKEKHQLQEEWLVTAGILGHYFADLAQPMHVTENHDGQLTKQKGLHHWFEENIVDELSPLLYEAVFEKAKAQWKDFFEKHKKMSAFELSLELAKNSHAALPRVLEIDKKQGRSSEKKVSGAYKEIVIERLSLGVLYLATIWGSHLDWTYDGDRFFNFVATPAYIEPGT
jgi:S1/P1 Nuclease